ncbi:hypothetical protein SARC_07047 [Sphaeroforma arctica JP610]|uniref:Uncharacterized protein n=1 Tax=Sphaeroforma arctica JP610 TaxID=667725 RepID=A0A0L0FXC9_9EUKA|nr:hypothetical protein SARC_07047 [Sphaeroforma arctica JP610]KNC80593.1 hypothetical protein SARC_07047 [Sphaeroforma arctica JP610]|eukprot:XP_014154495.1 hypothetical protein SARC_07047 [Sphaeroforma arctica JP610]
MMAHALLTEVFDNAMEGKPPKSMKLKKLKEKKGEKGPTKHSSNDPLKQSEQPESEPKSPTPQGQVALPSESEPKPNSEGEDSDDRDTDDYMRELRKLQGSEEDRQKKTHGGREVENFQRRRESITARV